MIRSFIAVRRGLEAPGYHKVKTASKRFTSLLQRAFPYFSQAFQRLADDVAEVIL
ncbi:MAG: hypothetical protein HYR94_14490 [Chloroflexi bacterium]|nr:hypothetical protein [Chloroflexota bacterium]